MIYPIVLAELLFKEGAFSASIPHLNRQQDDQEKQYVPAAYRKRNPANHWSLAYSAFACTSIGMSGAASFQDVRKSW